MLNVPALLAPLLKSPWFPVPVLFTVITTVTLLTVERSMAGVASVLFTPSNTAFPATYRGRALPLAVGWFPFPEMSVAYPIGSLSEVTAPVPFVFWKRDSLSSSLTANPLRAANSARMAASGSGAPPPPPAPVSARRQPVARRPITQTPWSARRDTASRRPCCGLQGSLRQWLHWWTTRRQRFRQATSSQRGTRQSLVRWRVARSQD